MTGALIRLMLWWLETPNAYSAEDIAWQFYRTVFRQPPPG